MGNASSAGTVVVHPSSTGKKLLYSGPFQTSLCTPVHVDCFDMISNPLDYDKNEVVFKSKVVSKNEVFVLI